MAKRGGFPGGMPGNMNNLMNQAQKMQKQMAEATILRVKLGRRWCFCYCFL